MFRRRHVKKCSDIHWEQLVLFVLPLQPQVPKSRAKPRWTIPETQPRSCTQQQRATWATWEPGADGRRLGERR